MYDIMTFCHDVNILLTYFQSYKQKTQFEIFLL